MDEKSSTKNRAEKSLQTMSEQPSFTLKAAIITFEILFWPILLIQTLRGIAEPWRVNPSRERWGVLAAGMTLYGLVGTWILQPEVFTQL